MSQCALQAEAGSPCSIAFALGRGCLHGLPQAPCGRAPLPGTWAPPRLAVAPPQALAGRGSRVPLEDQSVEVTTTATCRAAAPWGTFVLVFVFVKAPPPVRGRWERRDVGRPAPRLLLLLLETQMGMKQEASNVGSKATVLLSPPAPAATQPFGASPLGRAPRAGQQRGAPASPTGALLLSQRMGGPDPQPSCI